MSRFNSFTSLFLALNICLSPIAAFGQDKGIAGVTAQDKQKLDQVIEKEEQNVAKLSNEKVIIEFENLSALIYGPQTRDLVYADAHSSELQKKTVAKTLVRYAALKKRVESIPGAKAQVYKKLFGDREKSPYYNAISQDAFRDEGYLFLYAFTGSPIFLILYILANLGDR